MNTTAPEEVRRLQDLRQHWRASLAVLRTVGTPSTGKRRAWYLVIGPSGAGKSALLVNSGLQLCPITESPADALPTTDTVTLWHNEHAVFVEVCGRYLSEPAARPEWRALLQLLHRERGHLPVQGVLIAKPLAEQFRDGPTAAAADSTHLRDRLQDLAEITGSAIPAYVVITKSDLLGGFKEFFVNAERSERAQVLGMTKPWPASPDPVHGFIAEYERLLASLCDRRLAALSAAPSETAQRKLMQFPAQMRAAMPYINDYLTIALRPVADHPPGFRGLYFVSSFPTPKQTAKNMAAVVDPSVPPKSLFLGPAAAVAKVIESAPPVAAPADETTASLFLREMFTRIILPDAGLAAATPTALQRWRKLRVACLMVAPIVALLFCAWTGWSAWRGARVIDELRQPYAVLMEHERTMPADATTRLLALDQFGTAFANAVQSRGTGLGKTGTSCANRYLRSLRPLLLDDCVAAIRVDLAALRNQTVTPAASENDPYDLFRAYQMLGGTLEPEPEVIVAALTAGRRWFRAFEPAGVAASEYRIEALARHQLELCAKILIPAGYLRIEVDPSVVEALKREFAERIWLQRTYDDLLREITPQFAVVLPEILLDAPAQNPLTASGSVSLVYSQTAWDSTVSEAIDDHAGRLDKTLAKLNMPHDRETIVRRLRERYVADHNQRWLSFIASVRASQVRDFRDTPTQIERICGPDSPYPRFITKALDHLTLTISGAAPIRSPDALWVAPCLKAIADLRQDALAYQQSTDDKRLSETERLRILAARFNAVSAHIGDQLSLIQPVQNRDAIHQGFDSILRSLFADLDQNLVRDLDRRWNEQVYQVFTNRLANRFPFAEQAGDEVSMADFAAFFNPANGTLWSALGQIDLLRNTSVLGRPVLSLSNDSERMLHAAQDLRSLFFAGSSESLHLRFPYRMQQREHVRDLRMQFGATTNTLYERPDARYLAEIKRGDPYGAKISLQTAAGQWRTSEDIKGDWGFLRLLRAGNPKQITNGEVLCTWEYDASAMDKTATVKAGLILDAAGMGKVVVGDLLSAFSPPAHILPVQPAR